MHLPGISTNQEVKNHRINNTHVNSNNCQCKNENKEIYSPIPIHHFYLPKKKVKKIELKTLDGKSIPAKVIKTHSDSWYIECEGKCVATMLTSKSNATIKGDNYPKYYKNKKYLFINSINSHKTHKGAGTALIKAAVEESIRLGYGGRVCLNTTTTNPKVGSPVPFYYKLGFKSCELEKQKIIEKCIQNNDKIPSKCESTTMFLPQSSILALFSSNYNKFKN